ncbi:MAG: cobalamin biosynthesis protein [Janthinobacterium lividum]
MIVYTIGLGCRRGSSVAAIAAAVRAALGEHWFAALLPQAYEAVQPAATAVASSTVVPSTVASDTVAPRRHSAAPRACVQMATLDAKAAEPGLLAYCAHHRLPLRRFSRDALAQTSADAGTARGMHVSPPSGAVRARFGIDGVCELAALRASPQSVLLVRKTSLHGVSIALAGPAATDPAVEGPGILTYDRR